MNRRITRKVAEESAREISMLLYEERITELSNVCRAQLGLIIRKYIPNEVIQVVEKYPRYFQLTCWATIKCYRPGTSGGKENCEPVIGGAINFSFPKTDTPFIVISKDYELFRENYEKKKDLINEQNTVYKSTRDTILSYKTEKSLKADHPEIWKRLCWSNKDSTLNLSDINVEEQLKLKSSEKDG